MLPNLIHASGRTRAAGTLLQLPGLENHEELPLLPIGGDGGHAVQQQPQTLLVAQDEVKQPPNHSALLFRQIVQAATTVARHLAYLIPAATGFAYADELPKPVDHSRFLIGRTAPAQASQPYWLHRGPQRLVDDESVRGVNHDALHRYRTGFQTVGQPFWSIQKPPQRVEAEELRRVSDYSPLIFRQTVSGTTGGHFILPTTQLRLAVQDAVAQPPQHTALLFNRTTVSAGAATYQPLFRWTSPPKSVEAEAQPVQPLAYFWWVAQTPIYSQPVLLWPRVVTSVEAEGQPAQPNHNRLIYPRVAPQGPTYQPLFRWPRFVGTAEAEQIKPVSPAGLFSYRWPQIAATFQPLLRWPSAAARAQDDANTSQPDHSGLHRYRVGYQTVGQPYWTLQGKPQRVEAEAPAMPARHPWVQGSYVVAVTPTTYTRFSVPREQVRFAAKVETVRYTVDIEQTQFEARKHDG